MCLPALSSYLLLHDMTEAPLNILFALHKIPQKHHSALLLCTGSHKTTQRFCFAQGPTSSGKTSLVTYLAAQTGHQLVRINNHEQTELQEYVGSYVTNEQGKLVFQEGALVQALRKGHWLLLDELNLAPSQVLEALNRYLSGPECLG